jgi:transglutaminase-like putative cysteine protease
VHYTIHHVTKFSYETPVRESVMEVRMQPRSEGAQRCVRFGLSTTPAARVKMYDDRDGNTVHHFNIPGRHSRLVVTAEALIDMGRRRRCPTRSDPAPGIASTRSPPTANSGICSIPATSPARRRCSTS